MWLRFVINLGKFEFQLQLKFEFDFKLILEFEFGQDLE
jgi:hypothetical protein